MQTLASLVPSTYAIPAWVAIEQRGASLFDASEYLVPLATLSVFYMVLGLVLTHLRDGSKLKTGEM
jgi:ABC-2 type transport system permease protein